MVLGALLICAAASGACRFKPQEGGKRKADGGMFDSGQPEPMSCAELGCTAPASCEMQNGKPVCACPAGYTGDAHGCKDVDECSVASGNDCDEHAVCKNRDGSFECQCAEGYFGNGRTCMLLNDCEGTANTCHIDAQCTKADEGVRCTCRDGFEGDGQVCRDVDECKKDELHTCAAHANCMNLRGSYDCSCDALHEGDGRVQCRNVCDAAQNDPMRCAAGGHGRCTFSPAAVASCTSCLPGYLGDGKRCDFNNECAGLGCGENTVCAGGAGSRRCECAPGFSGTPSTGCVDIDECQTGAASCDASTSACLNVPGGYVCDCLPGFSRKDGVCVNVDECALANDLCDQAATCTDTVGSYECKCNPGYEGDGYTCVDIDECTRGTNTCTKDGLTTCQNTPGSYACVCPKGYKGDTQGGGCYCDLSGYWALRENVKLYLPQRAVGDVVLIQGSTQYATVWELQRFSYDGQQITVERKGCGADTVAEVYSPLYEEVYSSSIPNNVYDTLPLEPGSSVALAKADALPMHPFVTPREANLLGMHMNDPLNDPWPKSSVDIAANAWVDTDHDGEPGITLWPEPTSKQTLHGKQGETYSYLPAALEDSSTIIATRVGCVSTTIRAIGNLQGRIESCGRLAGKVNAEKTEGRVHSCQVLRMADWNGFDVTCTAQDWANARKCSKDQIAFLDDQDQTTETTADFEMVKIADLTATNVDCNAVRKNLPAIPR